MLVQQPWLQIGSLAFYRPTPHLLRMPEPITRLNAALEGRYPIERELGEGGMATVYLADDLKHNRKVALKPPGDALPGLRSRTGAHAGRPTGRR